MRQFPSQEKVLQYWFVFTIWWYLCLMLSAFFPKLVDCFDYRDGLIYVQSPRPLIFHRSYRVSGQVAGTKTFRLRARIRPIRQFSPSLGCRQRLQRHFGQVRPYLYQAVLEASEELREQLVSQLHSDSEQPGVASGETSWHAFSAQFPGLKARVVALSVADLTLALDGELPVGSEIEFRLQDIELQGRVLWCRAEPGAGFRVGIQLEAIQHQQRQAIRDLLAGG